MALLNFLELENLAVVPVIEITDSAQAVPLAEALTDGGLPVAEITLRTAGALESIALIRRALPDFLVGAGSLLNAQQLALAVDAGAVFGVSPGFTPELLRTAQMREFPFIPGVSTVGEILRGLEAGITRFKFFPAETLGGVATLRTFAAPLAQADAAFMPTGGVRPENMADYLALPQVFAIGGSWIAPRRQIESGDFGTIATTAREATRLASAARSSA